MMNHTEQLLQRWKSLWGPIGPFAAADFWGARLLAAYQEPQRKYHDLRHLAECLAELDRAKPLAGDCRVIEIAIWFHDAVYQPRSVDNEEQSAEMAGRCLAEADCPAPMRVKVGEMVVATKRHLSNGDADTDFLLDVDLVILGRDEKRFAEYEQQIAAEYGWVPADVYRRERAKILAAFLSRRRIYRTSWFFERYESRARANLRASLAALDPASGAGNPR